MSRHARRGDNRHDSPREQPAQQPDPTEATGIFDAPPPGSFDQHNGWSGDQPTARETYLTGDYVVVEQADAGDDGADWDPHALISPAHDAQVDAGGQPAATEIEAATEAEGDLPAEAGESPTRTRRTGSRRSGNRRPRPEPVEVNDVRVVLVGTAAWLVAFAVLLPMRTTLRAHGHGMWPWICLTGTGLGLIGLYYVHRRREAMAAAEIDADERDDDPEHDGGPPHEAADRSAEPPTGLAPDLVGEPEPFHPGPQPEPGGWSPR